ncbi:hypothetical protein FXO38_04907 [Capsicum annuum]|nr:hypothetical protein FXO38_04907 [Capsicum annuum]
MTNKSQMQNAATNVGATSIASTSRANSPQPMTPTEKPKKFTGIDFKRWQQKMFFYLTTLCLQRFTTVDAPEALEGTSNKEHFMIVEAWKYSDFLGKNYILSVLQDDLYNIYSLIVNEAFQVASIIEKLPPMWKDFKNYLKHKRKEITVKDLIVPLRIKEDNKTTERMSKGNSIKCNLVGNPCEWWMDSSATRHVCANKELFLLCAPAQVEEMIYMANSTTAKVLDKFKYVEFGIVKTPLDVSFALQKNEGESDSQLEYARVL